MTRTQKLGRVVAASAIVAASTLTISSASATPRDADDDHKITLCHVTNSATNPYVVITVDVAAFDGRGRSNDHTHHVSYDGRTDEVAVDGECGATPPDPEPTPAPSPAP